MLPAEILVSEGEVSLRHGEVCMAERSLQGKDIPPTPQEEDGEGVVEIIGRHGVACLSRVLPESPGESLDRKLLPLKVERCGASHHLRSRSCKSRFTFRGNHSLGKF